MSWKIHIFFQNYWCRLTAYIFFFRIIGIIWQPATLVPEARYPNKWENIILINENSAVWGTLRPASGHTNREPHFHVRNRFRNWTAPLIHQMQIWRTARPSPGAIVPQKSLASSPIWSTLFRCAYKMLCLWMPRERIEPFHRSPRKLRENSGDEGKFVRYI